MPYGKSPAKMESAKQEKKNLLTENPIDDKGSALAMKGSWISKHCKSNFPSPLQNRGDGEKPKPKPKKEKGFFDKVKDEVSEIYHDHKGDGNMVSRAYNKAFPAPRGGYRKIIKDGKINYDPNKL